LALHLDLFTAEEKPKAYAVLKKLIADNGNMQQCGIIGCRVIFEVLAENGDVDLALHMIASKEFPAFGYWVALGETTLWEKFEREGDKHASGNHHMFGAISTFFYRQLAGIRVGENGVEIAPKYPESINYVKATHRTNDEIIIVEWKRENGKIVTDIKRTPV
jgi:alpha-L-rhamnosidase